MLILYKFIKNIQAVVNTTPDSVIQVDSIRPCDPMYDGIGTT